MYYTPLDIPANVLHTLVSYPDGFFPSHAHAFQTYIHAPNANSYKFTFSAKYSYVLYV